MRDEGIFIVAKVSAQRSEEILNKRTEEIQEKRWDKRKEIRRGEIGRECHRN